MDGIRDWLVACGATFGCREVHHYRWPDPSTRPEVPYMTYRAIRVNPEETAIRGPSTSGVEGEDPYTVFCGSSQQFVVTVQVDLYNSEFGIGWLAKCGVAAFKEQTVKNIFLRSNIGFLRVVQIEDRSTWDDERMNYHQRLTVLFNTVVTHTHKNYNAKVDTVTIDDAINTDID